MASLKYFNTSTNQWEVIKTDSINGVIPNNQTYIATQGQTTFTIPNGQIADAKLLQVSVNGLIRTDFVMTNNTTFQFLASLNSGDKVYAEWFEVSIPATIGHHSTHELNGQDPIDITKLTNYQGQIATPLSTAQTNITSLQNTQANHETRITTIEGKNLDSRVSTLETAKTTDETRLTNLENNTVTYIAPTLYNGCVANDASNYPPRYWKDKDGIVHYELAIKNGATAANIVIMTFPVGYRPINAVMCSGNADDNVSIIYWINPGANGELKILRNIGTGYVSGGLVILNGSFKAEA
jgi:hypothetical protein